MKISTLDAVKRLSARAKTEKARPYDKSTELIVNRLEQYKSKTSPVIDYYKNQGKYTSIHAKGTESEVFEALKQQVKNIMEGSY